MRYVSCDIETNGLCPEKNVILEVGAAIEDTKNIQLMEELDMFHCYILYPEEKIMSGNQYAIDLNKETIDKILNYKDYEDEYVFLKPNEVVKVFYNWLKSCGYNTIPINKKTRVGCVNFAGKNFGGFDYRFLRRLPEWEERIWQKHRYIDPGMLFVDWQKDDCIPDLATCKKRSNIEGIVTHDALDDALDVILTLRNYYVNNN
jgi:oligoribonuclease (3'-5' exoribonuclease)